MAAFFLPLSRPSGTSRPTGLHAGGRSRARSCAARKPRSPPTRGEGKQDQTPNGFGFSASSL